MQGNRLSGRLTSSFSPLTAVFPPALTRFAVILPWLTWPCFHHFSESSKSIVDWAYATYDPIDMALCHLNVLSAVPLYLIALFLFKLIWYKLVHAYVVLLGLYCTSGGSRGVSKFPYWNWYPGSLLKQSDWDSLIEQSDRNALITVVLLLEILMYCGRRKIAKREAWSWWPFIWSSTQIGLAFLSSWNPFQ